MKSFKDVYDEQKRYHWMKPLLKELKEKGFAISSNHLHRTVYIFGDNANESELPQAEGYDKLDDYLTDYSLGVQDHLTIEGNYEVASIHYSTLKGSYTDEAQYFSDFLLKNASYVRDLGSDSDWQANNICV